MRNYLEEYDVTNPSSIEEYAKKLIGKTFEQVCDEYDERHNFDMVLEENYAYAHENKNRKGGLGELIEERYFHYQANNDSRPDFHEAGVELKVTPYKINQNKSISAKERLVITMIDYFSVVDETFENSHLWAKSRLILLIYYLYQKELESRLKYRIDFVKLFSPSEEDLQIIKQDFEVIVSKIKAGKAHELSGGDTLYLEACPKASTAADRRKQPFSDELAKPRAFAFKTSYMTYVLNNYIVNEKEEIESIAKDSKFSSFEQYVINKIDEYKSLSIEDLCVKFEFANDKKPKNLEALLAYRMLGIKGNQAEEFVKANIVIKTIRIGKNNKIKESMSFPKFRFKELITETWEDSTFGNYLRNTRFLFVVYKYDENDCLRLMGSQFWNIPYEDLENEVRLVWEKTVNVLKEGLKISVVNGRNYNNFPKATENRVSHVRPHARNASDTDELPDGRQFPKQCFWLNNSYIYSQLEDKFKVDQQAKK